MRLSNPLVLATMAIAVALTAAPTHASPGDLYVAAANNNTIEECIPGGGRIGFRHWVECAGWPRL